MSAMPRGGRNYERGPPLAARLIVAVFLVSHAALAAAELLVVVPEVREPYRSVLAQIVDGIRTVASARVTQSTEKTAPNSRLNRSGSAAPVTIVLGSTAVSAAAQMSDRQSVIVGAVIMPTGEPPLPGISLEPDPGRLFDQLVRLQPRVRTVHWLYRPARSGWLLERAQAAADERKLRLVAVATLDARSAAQRYQEILATADSTTDALWLSQDPAILGEDSTLPDILERAWAKNVIVFSGSAQHVARGALFALFPDNVGMGADLAKMALRSGKGGATKFELNRSLRRAINRRTAEHLRIAMEPGDYDLVLPVR
ncbi:hypothetical protein [Immundisolibacter sp.]|uniref:hypothetical protein n=1 Tax=Immundisolibacter sp. TaxID=1934948 RepID=UPI003568103B